MSFYSYKNSGSTHCPCSLNGNEVLSGLNEKICIQVQRVYDSCLMQEQLKEQKVTKRSYGLVPTGTWTRRRTPAPSRICRSPLKAAARPRRRA